MATGAIAHGALVSQVLDLPFVYVRSSPKKHGLENLIEGDLLPNQRVVVIEDLISTGQSSLKAVEALRRAGANVIGMVAIFTYGFDVAKDNFEKANVPLYTLANYHDLIEYTLKAGIVNELQVEVLKQWRKSPQDWKGITQ